MTRCCWWPPHHAPLLLTSAIGRIHVEFLSSLLRPLPTFADANTRNVPSISGVITSRQQQACAMHVPLRTVSYTLCNLCILMYPYAWSLLFTVHPVRPWRLGVPHSLAKVNPPRLWAQRADQIGYCGTARREQCFSCGAESKEKNKQNITKWYNAARFLHSSHLFTTSPSPSPLHKIWVWEEIVVDLLVYLYQAAWSSMSGWRLLYLAQTRDRMQWFISVALESTPCTWSKSIKT